MIKLKNTCKKLLNNKGMGLAEVIVGMSVLGTVLLLFVGSSRNTADLVEKTETQTVLQKYMQAYVESMASNVGYYQINFAGDEVFETTDDPEKINEILPLAWNKNLITDAKECEKCLGRMGFIVIPFSNTYRGLYEVIFKATHPDLHGGAIQTFRFIVSAH